MSLEAPKVEIPPCALFVVDDVGDGRRRCLQAADVKRGTALCRKHERRRDRARRSGEDARREVDRRIAREAFEGYERRIRRRVARRAKR